MNEEAWQARLIAAEKQRRRATVDNDLSVLEGLTADSFHYAHINGLVEDKATYFARLESGAVRTLDSEASDIRVTQRPGYALMTGRSRLSYEWQGGPAGTIESLFLAVWEETGATWRISAYASTPLPAVEG